MSEATRPDAWITGVGLVSSLGDGVEAHWARLKSGKVAEPVVDETTAAPYSFHPLCEVAFETQIPGRGDRRQMGPWQLLGTYAAGLALSDAGLGDDAAAKADMNLLVAAGTGERDPESDAAIFEEVHDLPADQTGLNRLMMDTLRPTLFLSQLANLLAGNISIVHGVTGSSSSFMGAEMAGVAAVENAVRRVRAGRDRLFLVGGSFVAGRNEHLLALAGMKLAWMHAFKPVWQRAGQGGGAILGNVGAFLVIEEAEHAAARGAHAYAAIGEVASGRGGTLQPVRDAVRSLGPGPLLVMSGASGIEPQTSDERGVLEGLAADGFEPVVRGYASVLGLAAEAHFPAGLALAAIAADRGAAYDPFEGSGFEQPSSLAPDHVLVTTQGQWRGAGAGLLASTER